MHQIFPRHVINALSTDGGITVGNISDLAFNHEGVTILFLGELSAPCQPACGLSNTLLTILGAWACLRNVVL